MDTLTGSQHELDEKNLPGSKNYSSENFSTSNAQKKEDILPSKKDLDRFIEGNTYSIDSYKFVMASNSNPLEINDVEFVSLTQDFSNEDFVKVAFKSYLLREPAYSEVDFWVYDISIKNERYSCLRSLRQTTEFIDRHNSNSSLSNKLKKLIINNFFQKLLLSLIKLVRKIFGIKTTEIVTVANFIITGNEFLMGANIEIPQQGIKLKSSDLGIAGWVLHRMFQPIAVRILIDGKIIDEVFQSVPRSDVNQVFCLINEYNVWGYEFLLDNKKLPKKGTLEILAVISREIIIPIGMIRFSTY